MVARTSPAATVAPSLAETVRLSGAGGFHFVLHLHGFDDDQALTGLHGVAGGDQDADYFAGHRRRLLDAIGAWRRGGIPRSSGGGRALRSRSGGRR